MKIIQPPQLSQVTISKEKAMQFAMLIKDDVLEYCQKHHDDYVKHLEANQFNDPEAATELALIHAKP